MRLLACWPEVASIEEVVRMNDLPRSCGRARYSVLVLSLSMLLSSACFPARKEAAIDGIEMPEVVEADDCLVGEEIEMHFEVKNRSRSDLIVENIKLSCGCISMLEKPDVIPANRAASVRYKVMAKKEGENREFLRFEARRGEQKLTRVVRIDLSASNPIEISPNVLDFGALDPSQLPIRKEVGVWTDPRLVKVDVAVEGQGFKLEKVAEGTFAVSVSELPRSLTVGRLVVQGIKTQKFTANIMLQARRLGALVVRPESLFIGPIELGEAFERRVRVSVLGADGGSGLPRAEVIGNEATMNLEMTQTDTAGEFELVIRGVGGAEGIAKNDVLVKTGDSSDSIRLAVTLFGKFQ